VIVAEFRRCLAIFGDSRTFLRQCGQLGLYSAKLSDLDQYYLDLITNLLRLASAVHRYVGYCHYHHRWSLSIISWTPWKNHL